MKRLLFIPALAFILGGCTEKYDLDTGFTPPTALSSPSGIIELDVASSVPIVLSWEGGGADDGTVVLYDVFFADSKGSFETPSLTRSADVGLNQLSISHADVNLLAKQLGALPEGTISIVWTVRASKGGDMQFAPASNSFDVKRPAGLASIPDELYLYGSATAGDVGGGQQFRKVSDGVFDIFTVLTDGELCFRDGTGDGAVNFYIESSGKIVDEEGTTTVTATDLSGYNVAERITLDFHALTMKRDRIGEIHIIWAASYGEMGPAVSGNTEPDCRFVYEGNGVFARTIDRITHPFEHPAWGSTSSDDRYTLYAKINDVESHWRYTTVTPDNPPERNTPLTAYAIEEVNPTTAIGSNYQFDNKFKINNSLKNASNITVRVYGNKEGYFCHQFE